MRHTWHHTASLVLSNITAAAIATAVAAIATVAAAFNDEMPLQADLGELITGS